MDKNGNVKRVLIILTNCFCHRRLDKAILSVDATVEGRIRNLQKVVKDPALRTDLKEALDILRDKGVGKGHPDVINLLWPEGTVARGDLEGLTAVRRQLPKLNRELRESPPSPPSRPDLSNLSAPNLSLPKRDEIEDEFKNIFRSTPKGLKTPKYDILKTLEGEISLGVPEKVEIRSYGPFTIATTQSMGGAGFNTLASYLFGPNEVTLIVELEGGDAGDTEGVKNQWYSRMVGESWYDAWIRL